MQKTNERSKPIQAAKSGRNTIQVGGDYTKVSTINVSLWISIVIITIVAMGSHVAFRVVGSEDVPLHKMQINLRQN